MYSSVREIRTRLLSLLVRAFVFVLLLSLFFFLSIVSYFLTSQTSPIPMPFTGAIKGYYIGHGNWDGVETVFDTIDELSSLETLLLDKDHRIVLDRDSDPVSTAGSTYELKPSDFALDLEMGGQKIGLLVITSLSPWSRLGIARAVIFPVALISLLLSVFLVIVATVLVRRFVNPLADLIYAAREVTNGKLNTRISSEGPQDMRSLSESFNEMTASLERNDRERRDLLADIAHELRTPLSVIRGRLEGIVDGIYSADGSQVSLALEQTYLLERLVDDLRLLTLAETRQLHFEKKSVDLVHLSQHTIDMFFAEAQEKNMSLALENGNGNCTVELDPQRMEQVIGNLIGNSLRYIPDGSKIWLTFEETSDKVKLFVNDNGPGVAEDELPYLFDRFWRKDKSRTRSAGGTGLGLAIAKQLVEAQGGSIHACNLSEGGFQVVIEFKKK
ncbi:MAG: HAMP domain-containing protein [Anaerolineales bacterium]|nr:HAMP domain-containing protein [Anaerolineales bacterium]